MRVVVVGGGLAGLFVASELVALGIEDVVVVDKAPSPGGLVRTISRGGYHLEPAAGSFSLPNPSLGPILDRAGVGVTPAVGASLRHVFVDGQLLGLRPSPAVLTAPVMPLRAKLRVLAEPLVPLERSNDDETLAGFCERRFGRHAGRLLSGLMAAGVFAGDPAMLSARAAFPTLVELEHDAGSVLRGAVRRARSRPKGSPRPQIHVPIGGMAAMADTLADSLAGRFRGGFDVRAVTRDGEEWVIEGPERLSADVCVMAVSPDVAAGLLQGEVAGGPGVIESAPVAVVGLGGRGEVYLPEGFGALIGPDEGLVSVGVLFESSYAPMRAPHGSWLVKIIAGGARNPEVVDWDDERLVERMAGELQRLIGDVPNPEFVEVIRHRPGIPQYTTGHRRWLEAIDRRLAGTPGLYVTGWGYRGVGVAALAGESSRLARETARVGSG